MTQPIERLRTNSVCFTGHRFFSTPEDILRLRLSLAVRTQYERGFCWFLSGMALGFDLLAAETVLRLSEELPIHLAAVLPCPTNCYTAAWPEDQIKRQQTILGRADQTIVVSQTYHKTCMQKRNQYLVGSSSYLIACCERGRGGTAYTVRLARRDGIPVQNLALTSAQPRI